MNNLTLDKVLEKVRKSAKRISDGRTMIWHTSEWNICSHLRSELEREFSNYEIDVELIKIDGRRPDIVIHKEGVHTNNLVVFQVKKNPSFSDIENDFNKITTTFFNKPYNYKYGIFISIGKLPDPLPEFNKSKIRILEVDGYVLDEVELKKAD